MDIAKMNDAIGALFEPEEETTKVDAPQETRLVVPEKTAASVYSENAELMHEIEQYKEDRTESVRVLKLARDNIASFMEDGNYVASLVTGKNLKDIEAFSRLVTSLTIVTEKIDQLGHPNKVESYIEPKGRDKSAEPEASNKNTFNFFSTPAEMIAFFRNGSSSPGAVEQRKSGE